MGNKIFVMKSNLYESYNFNYNNLGMFGLSQSEFDLGMQRFVRGLSPKLLMLSIDYINDDKKYLNTVTVSPSGQIVNSGGINDIRTIYLLELLRMEQRRREYERIRVQEEKHIH